MLKGSALQSPLEFRQGYSKCSSQFSLRPVALLVLSENLAQRIPFEIFVFVSAHIPSASMVALHLSFLDSVGLAR